MLSLHSDLTPEQSTAWTELENERYELYLQQSKLERYSAALNKYRADLDEIYAQLEAHRKIISNDEKSIENDRDDLELERAELAAEKDALSVARASFQSDLDIYEELKKAQVELGELREKQVTECIICYDNITRRICLIPCGHTVVCAKCVHDFDICPICDARIEKSIKLFLF